MFCWLLPHELWVGCAGVLFSAMVDVIKLVPIISSFTWVYYFCVLLSFCAIWVCQPYLQFCLVDLLARFWVCVCFCFFFIIILLPNQNIYICLKMFQMRLHIYNYSCKWIYLLKRHVPLAKLRFRGKLQQCQTYHTPFVWSFLLLHPFLYPKHDIWFPCVNSHLKKKPEHCFLMFFFFWPIMHKVMTFHLKVRFVVIFFWIM